MTLTVLENSWLQKSNWLHELMFYFSTVEESRTGSRHTFNNSFLSFFPVPTCILKNIHKQAFKPRHLIFIFDNIFLYDPFPHLKTEATPQSKVIYLPGTYVTSEIMLHDTQWDSDVDLSTASSTLYTRYFTKLNRYKVGEVKCLYLHWSTYVIICGNKEKYGEMRNRRETEKQSQEGFIQSWSNKSLQSLFSATGREGFCASSMLYLQTALWNENSAQMKSNFSTKIEMFRFRY